MNDPEFFEPSQKFLEHPEEDCARPRNSVLAGVSLVFGILSFLLLPVFPIVAIVTGKLALGEIDASGGRLGGRGAARAGVILGSIWFVVALVALVIVLFLFSFRVSNQATATIASPIPAGPARVKMSNEMSSAELDKIRLLGVTDNDVIICSYEKFGYPGGDRELAVLTNRQIIYAKGDRATIFDLKDVVSIFDDDQYRQQYHPNLLDGSHYSIEIKRKNGSRMRIEIVPASEGPVFSRGLLDAWKAAGGNPESEAQTKTR